MFGRKLVQTLQVVGLVLGVRGAANAACPGWTKTVHNPPSTCFHGQGNLSASTACNTTGQTQSWYATRQVSPQDSLFNAVQCQCGWTNWPHTIVCGPRTVYPNEYAYIQPVGYTMTHTRGATWSNGGQSCGGDYSTPQWSDQCNGTWYWASCC